MSENIVIILIGAIVGVLQSVIIGYLKGNASQIKMVCEKVSTMQMQLNNMQLQIVAKADSKESADEHKRLEIELGKYGDRVLTLELAVKVLEKPGRGGEGGSN